MYSKSAICFLQFETDLEKSEGDVNQIEFLLVKKVKHCKFSFAVWLPSNEVRG